MPVNGGTQIMTTVQAIYVQGGMWRVDVNIKESDEAWSTSNVSPKSRFVVEDTRQYEI